MERPNWIPYTPSAVNILLDEYKEYADHLEAALAREQESVHELGEANIRLRDLIREAAPVKWLMNGNLDWAHAWEKKALEDSDGS